MVQRGSSPIQECFRGLQMSPYPGPKAFVRDNEAVPDSVDSARHARTGIAVPLAPVATKFSRVA